MATEIKDTSKFSELKATDLGPDAQEPPSVLMAIMVGTASVIGGYFLVNWLSRSSKPQIAPWVISRGTGIALVVVSSLLVIVGLWMVHPKRNKRKSFPHIITLNSAHKTLAAIGAVLLFLHIASIIADSFANVGVLGALIPFESRFKPLPVALGTISLYAMVAIGLTAWLKLRLEKFNWKTIHRFAIFVYFVVMAHGITAGSDTIFLGALYLVSLAVVAALSVSRYVLDHSKKNDKRDASLAERKQSLPG
ncbi:MAG: hypothetical protein M0019_02475 [Actinomycetota bacterium]|nr:hypothetical protein [Actinomycetota bacterium]